MKITHFDAAYSDALGGNAGLRGKGVVSTVDPTVTDDSAHGYTIGVHWVNRTTGEEFVLVDGTAGAAIWTSTTAAFTNPMTTLDDIIIGGTVTGGVAAPARLGKGTDGQVLTVDPTTHHLLWATPGSGGGVTVQDEGTPLATVADTLDFVGAGVVATGAGATKTITISGAAVADILDIPTAEMDPTLVLAPVGDGTLEFRAEAGGGGSDLVQVASGAGSIVIPGLAASPDIVPASPSAYDEEFGAALSGSWTAFGTPDTCAANGTGHASNLHINKNSCAGIAGAYKASPSVPFAVTTRISGMRWGANYNSAGLVLAPAPPPNYWRVGPVNANASPPDVTTEIWTNTTTRSSFVDHNGYGGRVGYAATDWYLRLVVNSSTSVDVYISPNGLIWYAVSAAVNPGFTIANVGLYVSGTTGAIQAEAAFDWLRFVTGTAGQTWNGYAWV